MTFLFDATVENEFIVLIVEVAGEALSVNTDNIIVVDSALHDPGDKTTVILISRTTFIKQRWHTCLQSIRQICSSLSEGECKVQGAYK